MARCVPTGGAGAAGGGWRELSNRVREEAGEGPGHQDPLPYSCVQEVDRSPRGQGTCTPKR